MRTRIVSAFPGTGKTYYCQSNPNNSLDSDSSRFSWIKKEVRNPDFPDNYIKHIKSNIRLCEFIFVSSHKEVRKALLENCLHFYLIYPDKICKYDYLDRYKKRDSSKFFVKLLDDNWDNWIKECECELYGCTNIKMEHNYLEKEITRITCFEKDNV